MPFFLLVYTVPTVRYSVCYVYDYLSGYLLPSFIPESVDILDFGCGLRLGLSSAAWMM